MDQDQAKSLTVRGSAVRWLAGSTSVWLMSSTKLSSLLVSPYNTVINRCRYQSIKLNVLYRFQNKQCFANQAGHCYADVCDKVPTKGRGVCYIRWIFLLQVLDILMTLLRISHIHERHLWVPGAGGESGRGHSHKLASLHSREVGMKLTRSHLLISAPSI